MELVERSAPLAAPRELLNRAAAAQGCLVFLGGEADVGKTVLVRHFQAAVPSGTRVLAYAPAAAERAAAFRASREAAAQYARALRFADHLPSARPATRANPVLLTARELEVQARIAADCSNRLIADRLFCSPRTVAHHVSAILHKLVVPWRRAAVLAARRLGIV